MLDLQKRWSGVTPSACDICKCKLETAGSFIDGATRQGQWAIMCPSCHSLYGYGLGTGRGQQYSHRTGMKIDG